ncbi:MAG: family 1 glycosylhydrolase [Anaerolineae bacterium]|nr:family 1 glycosylhydrolase [Anaerolineae bacterium]
MNNTAFPPNFLWGASTAGHQVEGNNTNSDIWLIEHVAPTIYAEPSGDACDSLHRWGEDLDIVRDLGLNTYRFSLEWARIEPERGVFSAAMLDYYKRIVEGCHARGLTPLVTFNHFVAPRWFAARGGWDAADAGDYFARFCDRAARHLADGIGYALTLNEPNLMRLLNWLPFAFPPEMAQTEQAMLAAAAKACGTDTFSVANAGKLDDNKLQNMIAGHKAGYAAIKAVRSNLPVGVSLALTDDHAVGENSRRDEKRRDVYAAWLEAAKTGDFIGVQNYERQLIDANGVMPAPQGCERNQMGSEIYPAALEGAIRYAHEATGLPVIITENGLATLNDAQRAAFIPAALAGVARCISDGIPIWGYCHWSLLDNFEWIFGYGPHMGLVEVDRATFKRTAKPSAYVLGNIARRNSL